MFRWFKDRYSDSALLSKSDRRYVRWVCARRTMTIRKTPKSKKFKQLYSCYDDPDSKSVTNSNSDNESVCNESASDSQSDAGSDSESESDSESNSIYIRFTSNLHTIKSNCQKLIQFLIVIVTSIWFGLRFGLRLRLWGGFRFRFCVRF